MDTNQAAHNGKKILNYLDGRLNLYHTDANVRNAFNLICNFFYESENKELNPFIGSYHLDIKEKVLNAIQAKTLVLTENNPTNNALRFMLNESKVEEPANTLSTIELHVFDVYNRLRNILVSVLQDDTFELKYGGDDCFFAVHFTDEYLSSLPMENIHDKLQHLNTKIGCRLFEMQNAGDVTGFIFTQVREFVVKIYDQT
jgi:hypothetical protein